MTGRLPRAAMEELGEVERDLIVLHIAWAGIPADTQAGISLTCFRLADRLRLVREALEEWDPT